MFAAKDRAADILGAKFSIVRNGLDEGEVSAFIESLMTRNSDLALELERLQASLGEQLWDESLGSTTSRGDEADQEEASLIVAQARREAADIITEARRKVEVAEREADETLREAATCVETAKAVAEEEAGRLVAEMKEKADRLVQIRVAKAEDEGRTIIERATRTAEAEAGRIAEEARQMQIASSQLQEQSAAESLDAPREGPMTRQSAAPVSEQGGDAPAAAGENDRDLYEGTVDLTICPPIVLDRVVKLHRHLKRTPQVKVMEVRRSDDRGLKMRLHLPERTPLIEVLKAFPEVKQVAVPRREAALGAAGLGTGGRDRVRKVLVTTRR